MRHLLSFLSALLLTSVFARADGLIIIETPHAPVPGHFAFAPLEVGYHRVNVEIDDRVAVTSVDQEFRNPSAARLEGHYIFPLPSGAHIDKFSMDINGKQVDAELLPADKAKAIYEEIVRKTRDPALLEYAGRDAFRVRIFPIEPHSTKKIKIKYTQLCKEDAGLVEYAYPLNTEKFSSRLIPDVSVTVKIKSPDALKNIYSPSHEIDIKRDGDRAATIGYEERNARPDTDFKLLFSRESKDVGVKLLSYRPRESDDGYFMLMASPGNGIKDAKPSAKDIVFVLDTSGSMAEKDKLEQAKKALIYCLSNLNDADRFNLIRFSTEAEPLMAELEHPTAERVTRAKEYVQKLKPTGGTAIDDALAAALKFRQNDKRPFMIVFLTDGAPTVGITNEDEIVKRATARAADVRIFCFGIGHDVNTHLLDRIADATRAAGQYVLPDEDIEVKVASFYEKVKEPVMTDVKVAFTGDGMRTSQLYPAALPDLFKGDTLLLFGRYSGSGAASVKITGTIDGAERSFTEDANLSDGLAAAATRRSPKDDHHFIATLWATRRVGWLLDEIRLHGENPELKNEVVNLAREHGIVTPYTAYLIMEDEEKRNVPALSRSFDDLSKNEPAAAAAKDAYDSTVAESQSLSRRQGEQAVANAQAYGRLKTAQSAPQAVAAMPSPATAPASAGTAAPAQSPAGYRQAQNYNQQVKIVAGRAFYQNGNRWTDSTAQSRKDLKQQTIKFNSDEYFALARRDPRAAQWLALGNNIDVLIEDTLYEIRDQ